MQEYLNATFNMGGHLARALEGYKTRQGQVDYAEAVDKAIRAGRHLLVEGATGTGKSLAYSVPATYHAAKHNKRVLMVTSNIALQEQLMTKDLPMLAGAVPWSFSFKMLKGKSNYLCLWRAAEAQVSQRKLFRDEQTEMVEAIISWSAMTEDGDKSQLPFEPPHAVWREFSVTPDECRGGDCAFVNDCHPIRARNELETANVIVTNYHVLYAHLLVREATGRDIVLPPFDILVMDEGHRAAEIARDFLGFKISHYAIKRLAKLVGGQDQTSLESASKAYFEALASYYHSGNYRVRLKKRDPVPWSSLATKLAAIGDALAKMAEGATDAGERATLKKASRRAFEVGSQVTEAMSKRKPRVAYYLDEMRGGVALRSTVVDVDEWLRDHIFDAVGTVVVTSATLATTRGFDYIASELGADHYDELIVESPFDWSQQVLLVLPRLIDPKDKTYPDEVANHVVRAVQEASGRTLALFTSYRSLGISHKKLMAAGIKQEVMRQGDLPRTTLVEEFKDDVGSVLLGTESFWTGVDVPGEALSCLVIDKLPFPHFEDPVMSVLQEEQGGRWFFDHSMPRAVIRLKQGVGRLIRSVDDYGVVVLLDPRLTTKGYGKAFLKALPKMVKTRDMSVISKFLADMQGSRDSAQG